MMPRRAFTLLELLLAILVSGLLLALLVPVVVGATRAHRAAAAALAPLTREARAFDQLRHDLFEADPNTLRVDADATTLRQAGILSFHMHAPWPRPDTLGARRERGGLQIIWRAQEAADKSGLEWVRQRIFDLETDRNATYETDTDTTPVFSPEDVMLGNLASLRLDTLHGDTVVGTQNNDPSAASAGAPADADKSDESSPTALRVQWAERKADGSSGPLRVAVFELPLARLPADSNPAAPAKGARP